MSNRDFRKADAKIANAAQCDHFYGDEGLEEKCTRCGMSRDHAEMLGRAEHRGRRRQILLRNPVSRIWE